MAEPTKLPVNTDKATAPSVQGWRPFESLRREIDREHARREEETAGAEHRRALERADHEAQLLRDEEIESAKLDQKERTNAAQLEFTRSQHEQRLAFLGGLGELDADLTQVLVAENRNPDRLIELKGSADPSVLLQESA